MGNTLLSIERRAPMVGARRNAQVDRGGLLVVDVQRHLAREEEDAWHGGLLVVAGIPVTVAAPASFESSSRSANAANGGRQGAGGAAEHRVCGGMARAVCIPERCGEAR